MTLPVTLAIGQHLLFEPVISWKDPQLSETHPQKIVLTASIQSGPTPPISPTQTHMATTLALQMDAEVAMQLYEKLGSLGRSMGWLLRTED
jgi:hypothetical protein